MPNTYTQMHLQFVFAVKHRRSLIDPSWKDQLYKYITGIVQQNKHKLLAINGMPDHIHILVGMRPHQSVSDLLQDIKGSSSKWINENQLTDTKFEWQGGYGSFSYGKNQVDSIINYILNQELHHSKTTFLEEFIDLLKSYGIDYEERYLFQEPI